MVRRCRPPWDPARTLRRSSRSPGRLTGAIALATLALGPTPARAGHGGCDEPGVPCPIFAPVLEAGAEVGQPGAVSGVTFRFYQQDHTMPVVRARYLVPKGWRFAVSSLRPAQRPDGSPATSCADVHLGLGAHADDRPAVLGRAEDLAGGVGMSVHTDVTRTSSARNTTGSPARYGYLASNRASLSFVRWDPVGGSALLCMYAYARDGRLDRSLDVADPCNVRGDLRAQDDGVPPTLDPLCERAREFALPVVLSLIPPSDPLASSFGWRIDLDLAPVYRDPTLSAQDASIIYHLLYIAGHSGGNWNTDPLTGEPTSLAFSRAPSVAGTYEFRGTFWRCATGLDPTQVTACAGNALISATRSTTERIGGGALHRWGKVSAPGELPGVLPSGFGMVLGSSDVAVRWTQFREPLEPVKGYVLAVAIPGDDRHVHYEYVVTDPSDPARDPRLPCGPSGDAIGCSLPLSFPLETTGDRQLIGNGKLNVGLVTLFSDGHRSDGICDDGTPRGSPCPDAMPAFDVVPRDRNDPGCLLFPPGVSAAQFLIRRTPWPAAYVQAKAEAPSGGPERCDAPSQLLLLDRAGRRAEFVFWNPFGREEVFAAPSLTIAGVEDPLSGAPLALVSFGGGQIAGNAPAWRFDGAVTPALGLGCLEPLTQTQALLAALDDTILSAGGPLRDPLGRHVREALLRAIDQREGARDAALGSARGARDALPQGVRDRVPDPVGVLEGTSVCVSDAIGALTRYDTRGLPGTPNGLPTADTRLFQGALARS